MVYSSHRWKIHLIISCISLITFSTTLVFSQEALNEDSDLNSPQTEAIVLEVEEDKDYYIQENEEGVIFIQTLSWQETEYALRYEVIIEQQLDNDSWEYVGTYNSDVNEVEVSLFSGTYRYKVLVYNFLDLLEAESPLFELEIFQAIQPSIDNLSPGLIYLDEEQSGIFSFDSENVLEDTVFYLEIPGNPERTTYGTVLEQNRNSSRIQFDIDEIDVGEYVFTAENPGGLFAKVDPFTVKFLKPYDLNVTAGYNFGYIIPGEVSSYFQDSILPFGAGLKVTYIPLKRNFGHIGLELGGHWFMMDSSFDVYKVSTHIIPANLSFVYQYPIIKKRIILDLSVGGGAVLFVQSRFVFENAVESDPLNVLGIGATAAASLQFYLSNRLFIEVGADYFVSFATNNVTQLVSPSLNIGWQF